MAGDMKDGAFGFRLIGEASVIPTPVPAAGALHRLAIPSGCRDSIVPSLRHPPVSFILSEVSIMSPE